MRTCRGLQEEKLDCWILLIFLFKFENKKVHPSFSIISLLLYLNIYLFLVLLFIIPQLWKLKQLIETLRDVLRRLLYGPKNFYPDKRLWRRDEMFRDEMFRDEMFWDEFYEPASGWAKETSQGFPKRVRETRNQILWCPDSKGPK